MEKITRDFKGVWIPKEIWLSKNLTLQEKVFLVEISSLDRDEKGCYAGNKYFSEFFGLSEDRCSSIISSLFKKLYIDVNVEKFSGKSKRIIKVIDSNTTRRKGKVGIGENAEWPLGENAAPNNTEENNTISKNTELRNSEVSLMDLFKEVNPSYKILFKRKNQWEAIRRMVAEHGEAKVLEMVTFLPKNNAAPFAPKITTPIQLEENLGKLQSYWRQKKAKAEQGTGIQMKVVTF